MVSILPLGITVRQCIRSAHCSVKYQHSSQITVPDLSKNWGQAVLVYRQTDSTLIPIICLQQYSRNVSFLILIPNALKPSFWYCRALNFLSPPQSKQCMTRSSVNNEIRRTKVMANIGQHENDRMMATTENESDKLFRL